MPLVDIIKEKVATRGKIVKIEIGDYTKAFRNPEQAMKKSKDPERIKTKKFAIFTVELEDGTLFEESHGVPKGVEYKEGKWVVVDKLNAIRSMKQANNWFVWYNSKYKKDPEVGDTVDIIINEQGFARIDVGKPF